MKELILHGCYVPYCIVCRATLCFKLKIMNTNSTATIKPPLTTSLFRGLRRSCPQCGLGHTLHSYLKVRSDCSECGEALGHIRADDFPPYLTIVTVGHVMAPLLLLSEQLYSPPTWLQMTLWPALAMLLMGLILPISKGFCLNLMWHLGLKGDER